MATHFQSRHKLGEILLNKRLITEEQIAEAIQVQLKSGHRVGQIMVEKGWVSEEQILIVISEQFSLPYIWLRAGLYDPAALSLLDKATARRLNIFPLIKVRNVLSVATADPQALPHFDEIEVKTGLRVRPVLARIEDIRRCIEEAYSGAGLVPEYLGDLEEDFQVLESQMPDDFTAIDEMAGASPVITLVNSILQRAVRDGASDVHIEPARTKCRIRFRIDGMLYEVMGTRMEMHSAIISRLKIMANLDISERRLPQDGRFQVYTSGRVVDLRFSSLPGIFGEKVVLRVLDKEKAIFPLEQLGMTDGNLERFRALLLRTHGLVLVTGPTGSGKSTTLYSAINHLNCLEKNIITIEDPVEYQLEIINQNQVKEGINLTFARILKHALRQDPDIIMVGEIRERETAEIAVRAALTGHLVFSTLHTNDSIGAITRMIDMEIESYLLASALIGVIGQRLVRLVCPECKTTYLPIKEIRQRLGIDEQENILLSRGRGCPACYDSGYRGRIALHEILTVDPDLQQLMISRPSRQDLDNSLKEKNFITLLDDGYDRVRRGLTSIEEVVRVVNVI